MKRVLYLSFLATMLAQGASSSKAVFPVSPDESLEPVSDSQCPDYSTDISYRIGYPADETRRTSMEAYTRTQGAIMRAVNEIIMEQGILHSPVEFLLRDLASPAVKRIERETISSWKSVYKNGETKHCKLERPLAETSFGKLYKHLATIGFSNALITLNRVIAGKGIALFMESIFNPLTKEALEKTFATTNLAQAKQAWYEYSRIFGGNILRKLNTSIPGIQLKPTVYETIKANAHIELTPEQEIEYMAAQLAIAYSLSLQYKLDAAAFAEKASLLRTGVVVTELQPEPFRGGECFDTQSFFRDDVTDETTSEATSSCASTAISSIYAQKKLDAYAERAKTVFTFVDA